MSLITITGCLGSGSRQVAARVAETLGVPLYDDQRLQQTARRVGGDLLVGLGEMQAGVPGFFERLLSNRPEVFRELMEAVVYEVAKGGAGVIVGHGSQFLLQDFGCALHVRLTASEATRRQRVAQMKQLDPDTAARILRRADDQQAAFFQFAFHRPWDDPSLFDLVIRTDKLSCASAAEIVVGAARGPEVRTCSLTAREAMERLGLAKRIEAALVKENFSPVYVQVKVLPEGVALLRGLAESEEDRRRIEQLAAGVAGVRHVRNEVAVRPSVLI